MVILLLALACDPPGPAPAVIVEPPDALDAVALLARASLDLRGRRPSEAEIVAVEADPAALEDLLDTFVADDAFPERLVSLYAEVFRTRADRFAVNLDNDAAFVDEDVKLTFRHSVGGEPLHLVAWVAANDLPYTDIVTADYTMADDVMLEHLPLVPVTPGIEGWQPARYQDERPAFGVLSTSGMWWRYTSTFENANRGRAMAVARILLCDDRFDAAVSFQGDSVDLEERVRDDPTCVGCHSTLDPLGSYLWGFIWRNHEAWLEVTRYNAATELYWAAETGVAPTFYGAPGDVFDLGEQIAADPRFVSCAVETGMKALLNRPLVSSDAAWQIAHRERFLAGGLTLRALYRALVDDPRYREADSDRDGASPLRTMRPDQLAGSLQALTGYRWAWQGNDMLDTDDDGVRVLAGGVDGVIATEPASDPSTTTTLALERVAEAAAQWAVRREGPLDPAARTLFREASLVDVPDDATLSLQIQALVLRCHGRRVDLDDPEVVALAALWQAVYADSADVAESWALLLSGLFRHPDFVMY